jgi:AcrR family transcriptional regulator
MAQVLKEEIRERILQAALEEFYCRGFAAATMRSIAKGAGVPAGLIYSYYANKEALFDEVLLPVRFNWKRVLTEGVQQHGEQLNQLSKAEQDCIRTLLKHRKEFIILMDKSDKTKYQGEKEKFIQEIEEHLASHRDLYEAYDEVYVHIIVDNFVEGLLQIMYHYKNDQWAMNTMEKLTKMYLVGIGL